MKAASAPDPAGLGFASILTVLDPGADTVRIQRAIQQTAPKPEGKKLSVQMTVDQQSESLGFKAEARPFAPVPWANCSIILLITDL